MSRPAGPTRTEAIKGVTEELRTAGIESARLEAERLVADAVGLARHELLLTGAERLSAEQAVALAAAVSRRLAGEPLQHVQGSVQFRELVLVSDRRALIPRPETEQLVERVVEWAGERMPLERALDIGTGSGAIALSLLTEGVARHVVGLDRSKEALDQASENRRHAGVAESRFELRPVPDRIWDAVERTERFDLIVSNPPYIAELELESLPVEVRCHEPRVALAGGESGLEVVREILEGAADHLESEGALFLELGIEQADPVGERLRATGDWERVEVLADLTSRPRFVRATRRKPA